ncbi:FUSC family protein [Flammeovirga sp. SubArs3]|uniref:FUSC family protein n=1 Tax=Flammeovirga sp. SubArs3 TaxID=2995316 RepID=UPI00248CBAD1|nr:FUSC family protein [Flammeovirga sp. SubArs3]
MENRQVKEAVKVALSFVITYAVALQLNWFDPAWAGFGICMVAMPNFRIDQSFRKGTLRIIGTVIGSIVGLIILALAPQSRFLFMFLAGLWVFITMYMMMADVKHSYLWNVLGFTCLIITTAGASDPINAFDHALYRTLENVLGVGIYTIISFVIWPYYEQRKPKQAASELIDHLQKQFELIKYQFQHKTIDASTFNHKMEKSKSELVDLLSLADYNNTDDHKRKDLWVDFVFRYNKVSNSLVSLLINVEELNHEEDVYLEKKPFIAAYNEIHQRLSQVVQMLKLEATTFTFNKVTILIDQENHLNKLQYTRLKLIQEEMYDLMNELEELTYVTNHLVNDSPNRFRKVAKHKVYDFTLLDKQYFVGALYATFAVMGGFLIWIFFDPPGHSQWYMSSGANAMFIALTPQLKAKEFLKYFAIMSFFTTLIYTFIMPALGSFYTLSVFLFIYMFINYYYLRGFAFVTAAFGVMLLGITNENQSYDFYGIINTDIFNTISLLWLVVLGYMLNTTRPEKAFMNKINGFFNSAHYLLVHAKHKVKWYQLSKVIKYRLAKREVEVAAMTLEKWSAVIKYDLFDGITEQQLNDITFYIHRISKRIQLLIKRMKESNTPEESLMEFSTLKEETLYMLQDEKIGNSSSIIPIKAKAQNILERLDKSNASLDFHKILNNYWVLIHIMEEYKQYSNKMRWETLKEERFA